MKFTFLFFLGLSMVSFEALSQIPGRAAPQPDPLLLLLFSLLPFVLIFIMVVALLYVARWIFKARYKEKMQLLQSIEQHLSVMAQSKMAVKNTPELKEAESLHD